jgi:hypothetical protein
LENHRQFVGCRSLDTSWRSAFIAGFFWRFFMEFDSVSDKIISPFNWMEYTTQEMQKRGEIKPDTPQSRYNIRRRELLARKKAEQMQSYNNQKI